ncbi:hypothetical protein DEA8626_01476 [Defluviimonas aquaemixtae]|uniref:Uncharacterized protein n=1 Tax=Albidovulum aquaemixtae TaxID=1542388 RepID=A0A2R8B5S4_9RHOB|nr:hypothetical protein [Defluviimonas aquaemixtae]SPH17947.1 hypothetical protein DEA8626_01476 [Defluviimonas aquaemixtae]
MPTTEELGIALAADVLKAVDETGDEALVTDINKIIEASSSALQEAFMAAVRAQRAEAKARQLLNTRIARAKAAAKAAQG